MMLVVQIAAGIILAYALITNRGSVLKWANWAMVAFVGAAALAALIWTGSEAVGAVSPYLPRFYSKVGNAIFGMGVVAIAVFGGFCLLQLCQAFGWRKGKESSQIAVAVSSIANAGLVWLVSWPILEFTIVGNWYAAIDLWSRAHGYADAGSVGVASVFWLWPVLPLWIAA